MSSPYTYLPSLGAYEQVNIGGASIGVGCSSLGNLRAPVTFSAGPMGFCCTPAEAIALGDAMIRIANHYTAALAEAEYQASLGEQAVKS
jgi:hypothetical protein